MSPNADTPATLPRDARRLSWAREAAGDATLGLARASTDAGFRSYWRTTGPEPSRIVMDSPPDKEDVKPWLRIRKMLEEAGEQARHAHARLFEQGADAQPGLHILLVRR